MYIKRAFFVINFKGQFYKNKSSINDMYNNIIIINTKKIIK